MILALFATAACSGTDSGSPDAEDTAETVLPDTGDDVVYEVLPETHEPGEDLPLPDGLDTAPDIAPDGIDIPWPEDTYISIDEVYQRFVANDPDMLLLNVVDEEFYNLGHIPGSIAIPWDLLSEHLDMVDSSRHVVVYCRRGVRSEPAYVTLSDAGYPYLWIMSGGLEPWIAAGYPTVPCEDVSVTCL